VFVSTPDNLTLTGNKAQMCYDSAFYLVVDTNPIVNSNIGNDASGINAGPSPTMFVICATDCSGSQINLNKLDGGGNEQQGLLFCPGVGNGATISGNTVTNMQGTGIEVACAGGATVSNNTVLNSSDVDDLFGIYLNSDDNTLTGSTVSGGFDNGIEVGGDSNVVNNNIKVSNNGEDGIHVSGANASLTGNTTTNNAGEGIEDDGNLTTLTNNTSSGNRQDCAGTDALFVDGGGNVCADGTFFDDPGVITAPVRRHHLTH
jgi:parallel beta-helix repeat protein